FAEQCACLPRHYARAAGYAVVEVEVQEFLQLLDAESEHPLFALEVRRYLAQLLPLRQHLGHASQADGPETSALVFDQDVGDVHEVPEQRIIHAVELRE